MNMLIQLIINAYDTLIISYWATSAWKTSTQMIFAYYFWLEYLTYVEIQLLDWVVCWNSHRII